MYKRQTDEELAAMSSRRDPTQYGGSTRVYRHGEAHRVQQYGRAQGGEEGEAENWRSWTAVTVEHKVGALSPEPGFAAAGRVLRNYGYGGAELYSAVQSVERRQPAFVAMLVEMGVARPVAVRVAVFVFATLGVEANEEEPAAAAVAVESPSAPVVVEEGVSMNAIERLLGMLERLEAEQRAAFERGEYGGGPGTFRDGEHTELGDVDVGTGPGAGPPSRTPDLSPPRGMHSAGEGQKQQHPPDYSVSLDAPLRFSHPGLARVKLLEGEENHFAMQLKAGYSPLTLQVLKIVSYFGEFLADRLHAAGVTSELVPLLTEHAHNQQVLYHGFGAIAAMCGHPAALRMLWKTGAREAVVKLAPQLEPGPGGLWNVNLLRALEGLAGADDGADEVVRGISDTMRTNRAYATLRTLHKLRAPWAVQSILAQFGNTRQVLLYSMRVGAKLSRNEANRNVEATMAVVKWGLPPLLPRMMNEEDARYYEDREMLLAALKLIAATKGTWAASTHYGRYGGCAGLVGLLRRFENDPEILVATCHALVAVSQSCCRYDHEAELRSLGLELQLESLMAHNNEEVRKAATLALKKFKDTPTCGCCCCICAIM